MISINWDSGKKIEDLISMDGSINLVRNKFSNYFHSRFYLYYYRKFSNVSKKKPNRTDDLMKAKIVVWMFDECRCTLHTNLTVYNLSIQSLVCIAAFFNLKMVNNEHRKKGWETAREWMSLVLNTIWSAAILHYSFEMDRTLKKQKRTYSQKRKKKKQWSACWT